jgi:Flp pilus assembly secretin CpaC
LKLTPTTPAVETIRLYAGFAAVRRLDRPIDTVVVGNPDVIDGTVQSENRVASAAKKNPDRLM